MNEIQSIQKPQADPAVLAVEIRSLQQQARVVVMSYAVEIGKRLCEAKAVVPHGEWGNWLEEKVQFSQSTAQNYMKMYERFGSEQVSLFSDPKSEAIMNLPYTKALKLLAVPEEEMDEFLEENDVDGMSTRELEKAIRERDEAKKEAQKWKDAVNQAAANSKMEAQRWKETVDQAADGALKAEETARRAKAEAESLRQQLEELQNKPVEVAVEAPSEEMLAEIRAQEAQKFQEEREKLEKKLASAEKKAEKADKEAATLRSAAQAAKAEGKKEAQADMDKANAERAAAVAGKAEAEARAEELERRLKLADSSAAVFQVYFTAVQEDCNRMMGLIKKAEPEQAEKFRKAMTALLGSVGNLLNA